MQGGGWSALRPEERPPMAEKRFAEDGAWRVMALIEALRLAWLELAARAPLP
jgi:hypothetical protein